MILYGDGIHDDTSAIQEMLDRGGIVTIEKNGTYLISKTLIIKSNTRFILAPGAKLLSAPFSKCALIENERFRDKSGQKDVNIEIIGGIFDGNCNNMGLDGTYEAKHRLDEPYSPELFKGKLMRFAHIDNIVIEKLTVKDPVSYGIQIADSVGFVVRDIFFDYNCMFGTTDGVHINGPASNGVIENLNGITNDDMVSLTTIDESHAEVTFGHIENVNIRNVSAKNGYSGVRLLSAGNYFLYNIVVCGVYGTYRHNAVLISHHFMTPDAENWFDNITVEHVHASKSSESLRPDQFCYWEKHNKELPVIWIENGIKAGNITLRDISRYEKAIDTEGYLVQIDKGAVIDRLTVENVFQTNAVGVNAPVWLNEAEIGEMTEKNVIKTPKTEQ